MAFLPVGRQCTSEKSRMVDPGGWLILTPAVCSHSLQIIFASSGLQCTAARELTSHCQQSLYYHVLLLTECILVSRGVGTDRPAGLFLPSTPAFPLSVPCGALVATLFLSLAGTNMDVPKPVEVFD